MLPDNELSSTPMPSMIIGGRSISAYITEDYEDGGIALNDPSEGLSYQIWHGFLEGDNIYVEASNTAKTLVYSGSFITEISFTFDQNMRIVIAFVQEDIAKLYWYDSTIEDYTTTIFEDGAFSPKVFLDDKRDSQIPVSDVILFYMNMQYLCCRNQRDRYGICYELAARGSYKINKVGMGKNLRIQIILE